MPETPDHHSTDGHARKDPLTDAPHAAASEAAPLDPAALLAAAPVEPTIMLGDTEVPPFDWALLLIPTPLAMVRSQLDYSWTELAKCLATLTQAEYEWEPGPDALRVVRREHARAARAVGTGDWVVECPGQWSDSSQPRTIAWLVAHLTEVFFERWEWTFGAHQARHDELAYQGEVDAAVAQLGSWAQAWRDGVGHLAEDQVFTVGLSQATPIDAASPFGHLVLHINRELIHHGSEIMGLQDLFRAHAGTTHPSSASAT